MNTEQRFNVLVSGINDGLVYRGRHVADKEARKLERRSHLKGCIIVVPAV